MAGRLFHDDFPQGGTPGKENRIEALLQKQVIDVPAAGEDGDICFIKTFPDHRRHDGAGVPGIVRRFQNHTVSGGHGPDEGIHEQLERIIPGRHDQNHPIGLGNDLTGARKIKQVVELLFRAGKSMEMFDLIFQFLHDKSDFRAIGFKGVFVQIGMQGL